jgi:VCBS repeat-containing protein
MVAACGGDGIVLPDESRPAKIAIVSGDGQSAPAGATLGAPIVVKVTDALDRPVEGQTVAFAIDAGGGQVSPASAQTGSDGQASATWTLGNAAGQQRVQATVSGDDLLVKFSASAVSGVGALLELVSGDNQVAAVGSALADSLVVRVTDSLGNPVAGVEVQWSAVGGGSVSPASVPSGADGTAAAERVLGNTAGPQTTQASSAGISSVTFTQTAEAANPTSLVLVSGDAQTGAVGTPLADSLAVRLVDDNGNGVGGKAISWVVGTGGGSPSPATTTTNPNGFARTQWTLGPNAGSNLMNAVFSGVPSVPFTATAAAGEATKLAFTQPPVTTSAGGTITPAVRVAIQDASGNTVTSAAAQVTLAIEANPGSGTLSGTTTVSAVNGVAVFSNLSIDKAGNGYTLIAAAGGLTGATSPRFDILPGNANRLVFTVGPSSTVVGQTFSPSIQVQVQDAGGNPVISAFNSITLVSSVTGTLAGTATQNAFLGTATFSNLSVTKAGTGYALTALSSGLVSATSGSFDVAKGGTTITIGTHNPNPSVPGQNVTVNYDINVTSPAAGSLTGSVTVSDGTTTCTGGVNAGTGTGSCALPLPDAGPHQLTATYSGDANFVGSASASVNHTVSKAATTLTITQDTPDPSLVGAVVTVHWNLTSAGSTPVSGDVTLAVSGGGETCNAPAVLGAGSCDVTFTGNGARTISASYPGDANYNASSDNNEPHGVLGQTATSVVSSLNPSTVGQSVTFTAHVSATSGSGAVTGQVRFFDDGNQIGSPVALNGSGDAVLATTALSQGPHPITAAYQGSTLFASSTSSAFTQNVDPVPNVPPTADDDSYPVLEDGTLNVSAGNGVLKNDDDPDGGPQPLVARNASAPTHGAVLLDPSGSLQYTPVANYNGTDTFTYEAFDGAAATTATVTITITAVNDAPTAADDGPYSVAQDTPTTLNGLLANDSDVEGSALTAAKASDPSHGSVTVFSDGSFLYAPELGFTGQDSFTYVANDGALDSAPATVTIDVQ